MEMNSERCRGIVQDLWGISLFWRGHFSSRTGERPKSHCTHTVEYIVEPGQAAKCAWFMRTVRIHLRARAPRTTYIYIGGSDRVLVVLRFMYLIMRCVRLVWVRLVRNICAYKTHAHCHWLEHTSRTKRTHIDVDEMDFLMALFGVANISNEKRHGYLSCTWRIFFVEPLARLWEYCVISWVRFI